jgi:large subunit ribosomal protein L5
LAPRLKEFYRQEVLLALQKEFSYGCVMEVPRLVKIIVNIGLGEALSNPRALELPPPTSRRSPARSRRQPGKRSIANFKVRQGNPIGLSVTVRGDRMWEFYDRLVNATLPRIRDFRGVSNKAFDGRGNYSLGLREQLIFPEIEYDKIDRIRGMQIVIVTTARNDGRKPSCICWECPSVTTERLIRGAVSGQDIEDGRLRRPQVPSRQKNRCRICRPAAGVTCVCSVCAVSVSAICPLEGNLPGVKKSSW